MAEHRGQTRHRRMRRTYGTLAASGMALAGSLLSPFTQGRLGLQFHQDNQGAFLQGVEEKRSFEPLGPIALNVLLDDDGKPLRVKNKEDQYVGVQLRVGRWKASDGEEVAVTTGDLKSLVFAMDYLRHRLINAKIVERNSPPKNDKAEAAERIVAILWIPSEPHKRRPEDPHTTLAAIIRIKGTVYSEISSESLADASALERYLDQKNSSPF